MSNLEQEIAASSLKKLKADTLFGRVTDLIGDLTYFRDCLPTANFLVFTPSDNPNRIDQIYIKLLDDGLFEISGQRIVREGNRYRSKLIESFGSVETSNLRTMFILLTGINPPQ